MNSIATMSNPKKNNGPTAQSLALTAAIRRSKVTQMAVAEVADVTPGLVSQWATGHRPVPAGKARKVAEFLGIKDPSKISAGYGVVAENEGSNVLPLRRPEGEHALRPDLVIARLQNDVDALRYALAALVAVMTVHRPAEAADAVKAIRRSVPAKFRDQGFVHELTAVLDRASKS